MALNPRDQKKWDDLQTAGDGSIDKILAGKASDTDLKVLSKLLAEQHQLAGEIFDQSVADAQSTADTYIDQLNKRRIDAGKKPLTQKAHQRLHENSVKQVIAESLEDILAMVKQEFESHSEGVRDKVGEVLDKLQKSVKAKPAEQQSGPTTNLFERFAGYVGARDGFDPKEPAKRSLLDRALGRNRNPDDPQTSMLQSIKETVTSAKDKLTSFYDRFRNRDKGQDEEKAASTWIRKLRAVFDPVGNAYKKMKAGGSKLKNILSMIGKPLLLALMNPQLIKSITSAVGEYLSFDSIKTFISGLWDDTKNFASDMFDAAMDKVKAFFGKGKDKKAAQKATPLAPSAAISSSTTAAQAKAALPALTSQIAGAKSKVDAAQKAYDANPSAANKNALEDAKRQLQVLNVQYTQYAAKAQSAPTTAIEPATKAQQSVTSTPGGSDKPGPNTAMIAPSAARPAPAAVAPQMPLGTEIVDGMPVYRSGRPVDFKPKAKKEEQTEARKDTAASIIGLGSFSFDSSDSSLNILNMGMLA